MKYSAKAYARSLVELMRRKGLSGKEDALAEGFLQLLERSGDRKKLKEIIRSAELIACKKEGAKMIRVESARPLTENQKNLIKKIRNDKDVLEEKINSSLIAGIRITINEEEQFDGSLLGKITKMF